MALEFFNLLEVSEVLELIIQKEGYRGILGVGPKDRLVGNYEHQKSCGWNIL